MVGSMRAVAVLLLSCVLAAAAAGCIAVGNDQDKEQVLKSFARNSATTQQDTAYFTVAEGTSSVRIVVSTKPTEDNSNSVPGCDWCNWDDDDEDTPSGSVRFIVLKPNDTPADTMTLAYDAREESRIEGPVPGTWSISVQYVGGYDGPAALSVTKPTSTGSGGSFLAEYGLDFAGLVLALGTVGGGWYMLRRRSASLSRELHRIDHAFRRSTEDVEECRANLLQMRDGLKDMLTTRKLEESQYLILEKRIDQYLRDLETPGNRHGAPAAKLGVERIRQP